MSQPAETLRLHRFEPASRVNGPGARCVVWVQGCGLGCPGCFNPETHSFGAGYTQEVAALAAQIHDLPGIEGLTVSGGEPFAQPRALAALLRLVRQKTHLSTLVFSGFYMAELQRIPGSAEIFGLIDVLIAGRYVAGQRIASGLIGSGNKEIHFFSDRYTSADLENVPEAEILIAPDGDIRLSGIDPLNW